MLRDLELLQGFHVVELQKKGKNIVPHCSKELLVLPLVELKTKRLQEIKALV